jgi:hypothetical protein
MHAFLLHQKRLQHYARNRSKLATMQFGCQYFCDTASEQTEFLLFISRPPLRWLVTHKEQNLTQPPVLLKNTIGWHLNIPAPFKCREWGGHMNVTNLSKYMASGRKNIFCLHSHFIENRFQTFKTINSGPSRLLCPVFETILYNHSSTPVWILKFM